MNEIRRLRESDAVGDPSFMILVSSVAARIGGMRARANATATLREAGGQAHYKEQ